VLIPCPGRNAAHDVPAQVAPGRSPRGIDTSKTAFVSALLSFLMSRFGLARRDPCCPISGVRPLRLPPSADVVRS
jgi:hypothetical protein